MTKAELVADVQAAGVLDSKADAARAVDATLHCIASRLAKGEDVKFAGFGTFIVRDVAARKGRNPKTGEEIDIPAKKKVVFKAAKGILEA